MSITQEERHEQQQQHQLSKPSRQATKLVTATSISTIMLVLSGLTLSGTVIGLAVATPILVLFSPVLVPAILTVFAIALGLVFSGGCGVVAVSALSWVYQYVTGKHPPGADQLDSARIKIASAAREVTDRAKDVITSGTTQHESSSVRA